MENISNYKKGNNRRVQTSAELHGLCSVQNIFSEKIKRDVLGKTCNVSSRDGKCI